MTLHGDHSSGSSSPTANLDGESAATTTIESPGSPANIATESPPNIALESPASPGIASRADIDIDTPASPRNIALESPASPRNIALESPASAADIEVESRANVAIEARADIATESPSDTASPAAPTHVVDLGSLGLDEGAHVLIKRGFAAAPTIVVRGSSPTLAIDLPAWCRARGHTLARVDSATERSHTFTLTRGPHRWHAAERAGDANRSPTLATAPARWGLAARGALVEAGAPELDIPLAIWADEAPRLYAQAAAAQWDPNTAVPWDAPASHPAEVEDAIVQIMTYLIENETAALLVPVRFLGRLHPHYREVMQLLAIQAADEARHIEVFTRRARLRRSELGLSTASGQQSLATLFDESEFAVVSMLLSVLGEGSFLSLLWFIRDHAPDDCTREVARLAAQDEARHVAFGLAHIAHELTIDPSLRHRLALAIERRHAQLANTAGLNEEVFDALMLLAAGSWDPGALRRGQAAVVQLSRDMDDGRRLRLSRLGFSTEDAERLSSLHTRNFM